MTLRVLALSAVLIVAPGLASATVINFDDLPNATVLADVPGYGGFNWTNFGVGAGCVSNPGEGPGTIYCNAVTSSPNEAGYAYSGSATSASFSLAAPGTFTLNSFYLTARTVSFQNENLVVDGFKGGVLQDTVNLAPLTVPTLETLDWAGIDTVTFEPSFINLVFLDDVTINEPTGSGTGNTPSAVPEPSSLMFLGTGSLGMVAFARGRLRRA